MNTVSSHKQTRKYELRARADRQRETRDRIVAAVVALHGEVGPARTTIADIARRAGVQRLTVYNTFPTARELFTACQQRFMSANPMPDAMPRPAGDPWRGLQDALERVYRWFRDNEAMERHVHRDRHLVPALHALMTETADAAMTRIADAHAEAVSRRAIPPARRAVIRLAFEFRTWELLAAQGLTDKEMARLMTRAARGV
jgi:AcrR family transcriptional regulator